MQRDQKKLRHSVTAGLPLCPQSRSQPAHILHRHHTPNLSFKISLSSANSFVVLLGQKHVFQELLTSKKQLVCMNSQRACLATRLHTVFGIQGFTPTCKGRFKTNMWDQYHLDHKTKSGLESVQIPLSPTWYLFLYTVHHPKITLYSIAKKELSSQVKEDNSMHRAPQILL